MSCDAEDDDDEHYSMTPLKSPWRLTRPAGDS